MANTHVNLLSVLYWPRRASDDVSVSNCAKSHTRICPDDAMVMITAGRLLDDGSIAKSLILLRYYNWYMSTKLIY